MEWKQFNNEFPEINKDILFFDGENIHLVFINCNKELVSPGYYCNDPSCSWIYDDCGCYIIPDKNHFWMYLPSAPKDK